MAPRPQSEFEERVVQIDRVARVQKGGRRFRFRATVVIGDRKGRIGLGISKASDVQGAIRKAVAEAKKSVMTITIYEQSIPFSLTTTFAGAKLLLKPARPGTGIIAGGAVRPVIELSGITNILSKSLGSNNRINNAKAAMLALKQMSETDISKLAVSKSVTDEKTEKTAEQPPEPAGATK
ncbi:30S ribosomal protein S5 [Patescibacteria group bacterium]|nr:30S ribosomal protein S5 [Patescibacteria group bacterium]